MNKSYSFTYDGEQTRLDKFLVEKLSKDGRDDLSRTQIQTFITAGHVTVDGKVITKGSFSLEGAASIRIEVPPPITQNIEPCALPIDILFEDEVLMAVNKPAGLVVHPGAGNRTGTLANALAAKGAGEVLTLSRAGIVHRIDKETSGVIVVAKTQRSYLHLVRAFAERDVEKEYRALVLSTPRHDRHVTKIEQGKISLPIGRHPTKPTLMTVRDDGRPAATSWEILERMMYSALLKVKIETGRTHQIRVHMSHYGSPVIGDKVYGDFSLLPKSLREIHKKSTRHALHAHLVKLIHPESGKEIHFEAPVPKDFLELEDAFRSFR